MKLRSIFILSFIFATSALAEDWPFFRGPHLDGTSRDTKIKADFGAEPKIAWKAEVGIGAASFVVKGNRAITSGSQNNKDIVWCLDLETGKEIWRREIPCKFEERMFEGGTASTPTIDGEAVYNLSYDGQLHCLSLKDGAVVWKKHLLNDFGGKLSTWKYAGAPLVRGNLVILDNGGSGNSSLALDRKTGQKVWGNGSENAGYATPIPYERGGKPAVLVFKGTDLVSHDLASGQRQWNYPWKTSYDVNAPTPIALGGNRVLVMSGYKDGRTALLDVSGSKPREVWRNDEMKSKMSSALVHKGHAYAVAGNNGGKLMCLSLSDGKTAWEQGGFGEGSVILVGETLFALGEKGNLVAAAASPEGYQAIAEAQILPKRCWVTPAYANGHLLAKNNSGRVVCLDLRP